MEILEYKKRFEGLYSNLLGASATFYVWKGLQDESYEPIYKQEIYFWSAVLLGLQNEWLLSLAKCFEYGKYSKRNKVISVYALLKHHPDSIRAAQIEDLLKRHSKVIGGISRLRDNQLAHLNAEHWKNPAKLLTQFPIDYAEVEALFGDFPELFSLLNPDAGHGYGLDNYTKEPERESKYILTKIKYFNKKREEHMADFVAGNTDKHNFPTDGDT